MVMDATPSPQSVGREFVRQYYTLLNKAPDHLHRFYNNHSSFVHGGLEPHSREAPLVVGQKQIYNKIQQLNFRDCHAKISQVDAQSTLGNGVVVQVTGELSNDGQPMRRFTQTFVLAAQSPKKYYVHNDIFRYQDLFSDDEADGESRSENDDEQEPEIVESTNNQTTQFAQQPQQIFYPLGVAPTGQNVGIQAFPQPQQPQINGVVHDDLLQQVMPTPANLSTPNVQPQQTQQPPQPQQQAQVQPQLNTNEQSTMVNNAGTVVQQPQTQPMETNNSAEISTQSISIVAADNDLIKTESSVMEQEQIVEEPIAPVEEVVVKPLREEAPKNIPAEPKTYANLFKSEVSSGISFASAMSNNSSASTGLNSGTIRSANISSSTSSSTYSRNQDMRTETTPPSSLPNRSMNSRPIIRAPLERRSSNANQFGDNHQLFLGNVPHHATEDDLKTIFSKFGTIVDLRIHSKPGPKTPGIRAPQNYGFLTYDDPDSVQNCLANMPFYFPENSPDGQKLNVEEKKLRMRPNDNVNGMSRNMPTGLGSGGNNSNNNNGNSGNGPRMGGGGNGDLNRRGGPSSGNERGGSGGGMMRSGPPGSGGMPRSGPPQSGRPPFTRNDNRGGPGSGGGSGGGGMSRGGNGNQQNSVSGGGNNNYVRR